jgi:hypothetical protein
MLRVISQQRAAKPEQFHDPRIRHAVANSAPLALRIDKPAPAQTRKMVGNLRLCLLDRNDKLAHRHLTSLLKELKNANASRVAQPTKVLGYEIGLGRLIRKDKRGRRKTHSGQASNLRYISAF